LHSVDNNDAPRRPELSASALQSRSEGCVAELRADLLKWNLGAMATLTVIYSAIAAALRFVRP